MTSNATAQTLSFTTGGTGLSGGGSVNFAQPSKFLLSFTRLPNMTLMCSEANIPGVSLPPVKQSTPSVQAPLPGQKFQFEPLIIKFMLDENLWAWSSIFDWLNGIGFSTSSEKYTKLPMQQKIVQTNEPQYSDATLSYYNAYYNIVMSWSFQQVFPVGLGQIQFDTKLSAETTMYCDAVFMYTDYKYTRYIN